MPEQLSPRRKGESSEALAAFIAYRDLGPNRSLDAVAQSCTKSGPKPPPLSLLKRWSAKHDWVARAREYDDRIQAERDKVRLAEAARWQARVMESAEADYSLGSRLHERAGRILDLPLQRQKLSKDGKSYIIEPVKATVRDAATLAQAGSILRRDALAVALGTSDPAEGEVDEGPAMSRELATRLRAIISEATGRADEGE